MDDYIEKLLASRRRKQRILKNLAKGMKPAEVAKKEGCTRQYVEQVRKNETGN